jgi:hypothetical protein
MFLLHFLAEHNIHASALNNGCGQASKGSDATQTKSARASRPQALEQPSPRTAHDAKIGLAHKSCKQNLGNKKVTNEEIKALPFD